MKSYLLLGILLLYYLCMFLLIEGRSAGIKEESNNPRTKMQLLCPTFSNNSLQIKFGWTRTNGSLGKITDLPSE
ncbi:uncharacterized protein LOC116801605 isoform X2 [Drosophila sechellia]|uniref:uncharacterized protein LOC116801605 isoform X2 n=1 Tax=Drosophila sechellia TaxID=7238 RepID=UPI0013DDA25B|nr:uncharacterized protein LOC116801605 isoform X2 [Drosophila sechellia]